MKFAEFYSDRRFKVGQFYTVNTHPRYVFCINDTTRNAWSLYDARREFEFVDVVPTPVPPEPKKGEYYMVVYSTKEDETLMSGPYSTLNAAKSCGRYVRGEAIAVVKTEWTEGDGLDDTYNRKGS